MDLGEIKNALLARVVEVCSHLLPGGRQNGNYWHAGSLRGEPGSSLRVCLSGSKAGVWMEGDATGEAGDIIELWKNVRGSMLRDCIEEMHSFLGVTNHPMVVKKKKEYRRPTVETVKIAKRFDEYFKGRGIDPKFARAAGVAEMPGAKTMAFQYMKGGELLFVKKIDYDLNEKGKKIVSVEAGCEPCLFGMDHEIVQDHSGSIVITEGEIDSISWLQEGIAAVSVPFGAKGENKDGGSANDEWIENCWEFLEQFHTIYICMDNDDDGKKAEAYLVKRLGLERCKAVRLPKKDSNECVKAGIKLVPFLAEAKSLDPASIIFFGDGLEENWENIGVRREDTGHVLLDFEEFPFRIRAGETTGVVGYDGSGKSNFINQVACWLALVKGEASFIGSFENGYDRVIEKMCVHAMGRQFKKAEAGLKQRFKDQLGSMVVFHKPKGEVDYMEFFANAEYCVRKYKVKHVILDCVTSTNVDLDDLKSVDKFIKRVQLFCNQNPSVHTWILLHPSKDSAKGESSAPKKEKIRGSAIISNLLWNVVTVFVMPEDAKEPYDGKLVVSKQREGGKKPSIDVYYDQDSYRLQQAEGENKPYLKEEAEDDNIPF